MHILFICISYGVGERYSFIINFLITSFNLLSSVFSHSPLFSVLPVFLSIVSDDINFLVEAL